MKTTEPNQSSTDNVSALPPSAFKVPGPACLTRNVGQKIMNTPEKILKDAELVRVRRLEYEKALSSLKYATKTSQASGLYYFLVAGLMLWLFQRVFMNSGSMPKSDGFALVAYGLIVGSHVWLGISKIFPNPKDIALRNLIEERLERK